MIEVITAGIVGGMIVVALEAAFMFVIAKLEDRRVRKWMRERNANN